VGDLPIAGRVTYLVWRKRRYRCAGCGQTFTESPPELPTRQSVTRRFRRRLIARVRGGAAYAEVMRCERTTRYQVQRAFRAGAGDEFAARREAPPAQRLSQRRGPAPPRPGARDGRLRPRRGRVADVLDGRSRRRVERYLRSLPDGRSCGILCMTASPTDRANGRPTCDSPPRASAKTAFGPVQTSPEICLVKWTPRNAKDGSGTGQKSAPGSPDPSAERA
jgi:hypothetical protein